MVRHCGLLPAVALATMFALPAAASATFPGKNGEIAFATKNEEAGSVIYTIKPSGEGGRKFALNGAGPAYSASGRTLLYYSFFGDQQAGILAWPIGTSEQSPLFLTHPSQARVELDPAPAPDGTRFVFATRRADLFIAAVRTGAEYPRPRPLGKSGHCADWSPNGKSIVYLHRGAARDSIRRVSPQGVAQRSIYRGKRDDPLGCPSWSPDGKLVAFSAEARGTRFLEGAVLIATTSGRLKRQLRHPAVLNGESPSSAFSPDGKHIAYGSADQGLNVIRLRDNKRRRICECGVYGISWRSLPGT